MPSDYVGGPIRVILGLYWVYIGVIWGIMEKKMETIITMGSMGGYQNYGPFLGTLNIQVPYQNRDPKRDQNFDSHPCRRLYRAWEFR